MRRRRRVQKPPMAAKGRKHFCGVVLARTTDGHVQRCQARPHGDDERHNPGPWVYEESAA